MTHQDRGSQARVDEILFDARALQGPGPVSRRLVDHDVALLSAVRHREWPRGRPRLVGLVDHGAGPLREHHRLLFDEVATHRLRTGRRSRWFVAPAPMAHDPVWALPILLDPAILKVALIHETVSIEEATSLERRADDLTCLAWLGRYDLFAAGSRRVKADLEQVRRIDPSRIFVAGRPFRSGCQARPGDPGVPFEDRRHIVVTVDGCACEDIEGVAAAHARSKARERVSLMMLGRSPPETRSAVRTAYARAGGEQAALAFAEDPDDRHLGELYGGALLTVVPPQASEASLSCVVESTLSGTPVAMPEEAEPVDGITAAVLTYAQDDPDALVRVFDAVVGDAALWERARAAAADEGRFHAGDAGARRLIDGLVDRANALPRAPAVGRGLRPRLAILTPLPPATSGSAARSAATIEALSGRVDVHAFSDTPGAMPGRAVLSLAPVKGFERGARHFDASLSVLGNSRHHAGIFEHLVENGGAALVHDAHLVGFYAETFGLDRTLDVGRTECGGDLTRDQVAAWVRDPRDMPIPFLSEVAGAAAPLLVTSEDAREVIARRYGIAPKRLPPLQHRSVDRDRLAPEPRRALRDALGWTRNEVVLCGFGLGFAASAVAIWALRLLRDWRIEGRLALSGPIEDEDRARIDALARELDLAAWIDLVSERLSEREYVDCLVAADIAIGIGTHGLAGPSGTVLDCIAAALPMVSNEHVARTAEAPAFVRRVPDALSPVLIAEAALEIVSSGHLRSRPVDEARAFEAAHSPALYARALTEALGLDCGPA